MLGSTPLAFRPSCWGLCIWVAFIIGSLTPSMPLAQATAARKHASAASAHKRKHVQHPRPVLRRAAVFPVLRDGYGVAAPSGLQHVPVSVVKSAQVSKMQQTVPSKDGKAAPGPGKRPRKGPPTDYEILEDAQAAYVRGERQRAIDMALGVAEKNGSDAPAAWRFIGLAACSVRSQRLATRAYQNLPAASDQRVIVDACRHNGMAYRDDHFIGD